MTEEQENNIRDLAIQCDEAERAYQYAGFWNMPDDPVKRAKMAADYAVLRAKAFEARSKLNTAIHEVAK